MPSCEGERRARPTSLAFPFGRFVQERRADYPRVNVQKESTDPDSLLNWYRQLIALRRSNEALRNGRMVMLDGADASVLSYARVGETGKTGRFDVNTWAVGLQYSF